LHPVRTLGNRLKGYEVHHDCRCTASGPDQVDPADARLSRERNGGDRELVCALRSMNKDSFDGPNAVMKELKGSLTGSGD
jgi:hypothetical protein